MNPDTGELRRLLTVEIEQQRLASIDFKKRHRPARRTKSGMFQKPDSFSQILYGTIGEYMQRDLEGLANCDLPAI